MFSLYSDVKFWTFKSDVQIRESDFGAYKFYEKKDVNKSDVYLHSKENYAESRGNSIVIRNRRPERLKSALKQLEHVLQTQRIAYSEWREEGYLRLITLSGLIINIRTDLQTGTPLAIRFDRFLVGKITDVSDVSCTKTHIIFSHAENQLTLVYLIKPPARFGSAEKLQKLEPRLNVVELAGPSGRRLQRRVSANISGEFVLTWWQTSRHEVYPWAPNVKDRDRANVHLYSLSATHLELLSYFRTESDPLCVRFSRTKPHVLWAVEQKVSRKGDVTVENTCYHIVKRTLVKKAVTSIPLQTHVSCHAFSPDEERLVLGCIDGSIVLLDKGRGVTRQVRTAFIPMLLTWHCDGALLLVANDRAQLQWFDLALSCVRAQLVSEDVTPSNLVDLGAYFTSQPTLLKLNWSAKESVPFCSEKFVPNDNFLLMIFEGGPLSVLTIVGGGGLIGDIFSCGLTGDTLIRMYITWQQIDKAISLLMSLDWNTQGAQCLAGLYHITNAIFRSPLTPEKEIQLETALGCFHAPLRSLTSATLDEFSDQVHDLTRRFFHHLVRYQLYEKAFRLALDLNDVDLYLDLLSCARRLGDREMAQAVRQQISALGSGGSSCSCSSDEESLPPLPNVKRPPLPELSRFGRIRESALFTRPPAFSIIPEEPSHILTPDLPVDSNLPSVIEQLYDLPAKPRVPEKPRVLSVTPARNFMTEIGKPLNFSSSNNSNLNIPYIPPPPPSFSSLLKPLPSTSPPPYPNIFNSSIPNLPSLPTYSSASLQGGSTSTFSSVPEPASGPPIYPANPLSSHLYGAANKLEPKTNATPSKQKVKFSDTVTQIVVPDISHLSGGKPRRVKGVDPAQELADSLPLCLGNADYLKDFAKAREDEEELHGGTIKVIHFGVV